MSPRLKHERKADYVYTATGVAQILVTCITCGVGAVWGLIEGILILAGSTITTDAEGRSLKDP